MDEKRYPKIEENVGMVGEPSVAVASNSTSSIDGIHTVHDWIDELDWNRFPSYGPSSVEEAVKRIEKAEDDLKNPSKWVTSDEVHRYLSEKFPCLR